MTMHSKAHKPLLVIGCSEKKGTEAGRAMDLYQGGMFSLLNANLEAIDDYFELLVVSAKFGLIEGETVIPPYNTRMGKASDSTSLDAYVKQHSASAIRLLKSYSHKERDIYVILSKDYLTAFNALLGESKDAIIKRYKSAYISESHRGIGELRGRLKRVINLEKHRSHFEPVYFRSGVCNKSELAYLAAGESVGSSLAYVNTSKNTALLATLLESTKTRDLFIDNGIISNKGDNVDSNWVFSQYLTIANSLPKKNARRLWFVIPDSPQSTTEAIAIVRRHAQEIKTLKSKVNVILPIHKADNIRLHAYNLMKELNFIGNVTVGIPCLTKKELDFAIPLKDIDALLSMKNPRTQRPMFTGCHFLGMSEKTARSKLLPRLKLAALHNMTCTLDSCRTPALFGYNKTTPRIGKKLEIAFENKHEKAQVTTSSAYKDFTYESEFYSDKNQEPFVTENLWSMLNEEEIWDFIALFNLLVQDKAGWSIDTRFNEGEEQEAIEIAYSVSCNKSVEMHVFERLKEINWDYFKFKVEGLSKLSPHDKRFLAIKELFQGTAKSDPIQIQLPLTA